MLHLVMYQVIQFVHYGMATTYRDALTRALDSRQEHDVRDDAAERVALGYATMLDELGDEMLPKIGAAYLVVLEALGLTPRARAAATRGQVTAPAAAERNPADELRDRRNRRHA